MSLTVDILSTTDDPRVVSKTTTTIASVTAKPTDACSVLYPVLLLQYSGSLAAANYMYISAWGRYYYIDRIKLLPGNQIEIAGSVDVLKTYDTEIRSCTATVIRSESIGAPTMIPDNKLPINPNKKELLTAKFDFAIASGSSSDRRYFVKVRESSVAYTQPNEQRGDPDANQ